MERLKRFLARIRKEEISGGEWWEEIIDYSEKEARRLEREFQLSYRLGLTPGESRFLVECCLPREIALRREKEREEQLDKEGLERIRIGAPARAVLEYRNLELKPVRRPSEVLGDRSVHLVGELLFEWALSFDNIEFPRLSPQEQEFRTAKRSLLKTIADAAHLIYSLVAEEEGEPKKIIPICETQKNRILAEREKMVAFLKDPNLYEEAFFGERGADFSDGTGVKKPPPYLK